MHYSLSWKFFDSTPLPFFVRREWTPKMAGRKFGNKRTLEQQETKKKKLATSSPNFPKDRFAAVRFLLSLLVLVLHFFFLFFPKRLQILRVVTTSLAQLTRTLSVSRKGPIRSGASSNRQDGRLASLWGQWRRRTSSSSFVVNVLSTPRMIHSPDWPIFGVCSSNPLVFRDLLIYWTLSVLAGPRNFLAIRDWNRNCCDLYLLIPCQHHDICDAHI